MRLPRAARPRSAAPSIAPMVDMAFLLITFFVMTIRLGLAQEKEIELPRADQARAAHERAVEIVTIDIDRDGGAIWRGRPRTLDAIAAHIEERLGAGADVKVVLRADARAPFSAVRRAMRASAAAGVSKLSIAALRLGEDA